MQARPHGVGGLPSVAVHAGSEAGKLDPNGLSIRPATERDADAIWDVVAEVVASGRELAWRPGTPREEVMPAWVGPGLHPYVAETDGVVAGTYVLKANQPGLGSHVANGTYAVASRHRGRGIGRALGEHSIAEARRLGFRALQFNLVVAGNRASNALWESLGFDRLATLSGAYEAPDGSYVDAYVLYRSV